MFDLSSLDHFITADELKNVMKRLGQTLSDDEINLMITEADTDGDRQVNYKGISIFQLDFQKILNSSVFVLEFVQLMRRLDL